MVLGCIAFFYCAIKASRVILFKEVLLTFRLKNLVVAVGCYICDVYIQLRVGRNKNLKSG